MKNDNQQHEVKDSGDDVEDDDNKEWKLRVATINIGKSISHLSTVLEHANNNHIHLLSVTEMGDPVALKPILDSYGWLMVMNGDDQSGVALLVRSSLEPYVRKRLINGLPTCLAMAKAQKS